jgi:hypothetical protein
MIMRIAGRAAMLTQAKTRSRIEIASIDQDGHED